MIIPVADYERQVGTAWLDGYTLWGISCYVKFSSTTITFTNLLYGRYACGSLGSSLIFNAGDSTQIIAIYGFQYSVSRTIKYFSVADQDDITITAPFNCIIEVDAWYENQWPYGGGSQTLAIQTPSGLTSLTELVGRLIYGDTIGRTLHAFRAFSGGIKNTSYRFQMLPNGGGTNGSRVIIVKCIPIN